MSLVVIKMWLVHVTGSDYLQKVRLNLNYKMCFVICKEFFLFCKFIVDQNRFY